MSRKATVIIILQSFIIVILFWFLVFYGKDEYEELTSEGEEGVETRALIAPNEDAGKGAATLILPIASQQQSGIKTNKLQSTSHQASTTLFGTVEAIDGLVDLRTRYLAAMAESNVIRTSITSAQQNLKRLQLLNQDDKNVSDRVVHEAEATLKNEQAKLSAANTLTQGIQDNMRQVWGATLTNWATNKSVATHLSSFLQSNEVLLKITLPFDVTLNNQALLKINQIGLQTPLATASFVSEAAQADGTLQGKTYFYRAPANNLRAGMRISARLESEKQSSTGVIVPHEAVVWFANQAWVYQKVSADKFIRRLISTETEIESEAISGWYNSTGLAANDEVVITGAQLLLSEELKYQIKNENED